MFIEVINHVRIRQIFLQTFMQFSFYLEPMDFRLLLAIRENAHAWSHMKQNQSVLCFTLFIIDISYAHVYSFCTLHLCLQALYFTAAEGEVGGAGRARSEGEGGAQPGSPEESTTAAREPAAKDRGGQVEKKNSSNKK